MKWAFNIRRKISAALLLAAIFVLVFVKSMLDNQHFTQLGTSFSSVYEDRLMVESYIYRLSDHLFRKKIMIDTCESVASADRIRPVLANHNEAIEKILIAYDKTWLTAAESRIFGAFKNNIAELTALERSCLNAITTGGNIAAAKVRMDTAFNQASGNLADLSGIQITEGKKLNDQSKKIVAGSSLLTQFEMGILIAIGLMILVLVFESTSVFTRSAKKERLN